MMGNDKHQQQDDMLTLLAVPQGLHGMAEDVAADGLDDVLHEFRAVGFDAFPFLCGAYAFLSDGWPAEAVFSDTGLDI